MGGVKQGVRLDVRNRLLVVGVALSGLCCWQHFQDRGHVLSGRTCNYAMLQDERTSAVVVVVVDVAVVVAVAVVVLVVVSVGAASSCGDGCGP